MYLYRLTQLQGHNNSKYLNENLKILFSNIIIISKNQNVNTQIVVRMRFVNQIVKLFRYNDLFTYLPK